MDAGKRIVFFVSDRTGITAEVMGRSLLTQFDHIEFERHTLPFIDSPKRAAAALDWINRTAADTQTRPIVFSTLMQSELRAIVEQADALVVDFFDSFIGPLESELGTPSSGAVGKTHGMDNHYSQRMDALNFTLSHDDGLGTHIEDADIVLLGVSRSGKTPTSLYLALNYGMRAANYPLTPDDFEATELPVFLQRVKNSLFGLSIRPERLAQIREERKPGSDYAALSTCRSEVRQAESLFSHYQIPFLDTSTISIEEIAARILHETRLKPR